MFHTHISLTRSASRLAPSRTTRSPEFRKTNCPKPSEQDWRNLSGNPSKCQVPVQHSHCHPLPTQRVDHAHRGRRPLDHSCTTIFLGLRYPLQSCHSTLDTGSPAVLARDSLLVSDPNQRAPPRGSQLASCPRQISRDTSSRHKVSSKIPAVAPPRQRISSSRPLRFKEPSQTHRPTASGAVRTEGCNVVDVVATSHVTGVRGVRIAQSAEMHMGMFDPSRKGASSCCGSLTQLKKRSARGRRVEA